MTESEYGGLGLSIVVVLERDVIFKTKINGSVQYEVKVFKLIETEDREHCVETGEIL